MDKKLVALITLFFMSFGFFTAVLIFKDPLIQLTRAKEDSTPSPVRSKILAWPLSYLNADGNSESVINVFVVSQSDRPLANKVVTLTNTIGNLKEIAKTTDDNGKATFSITSTTRGIAEVEAIVEPDIKLGKKISIKFE